MKRYLIVIITMLLLPTTVFAAKDTIIETFSLLLNDTNQITAYNIDGKVYVSVESLETISNIDVKLNGNKIHIKLKDTKNPATPTNTPISTPTFTPTNAPTPTNIPIETTRNYIMPGDTKEFVLKVLGQPISINNSFNRYYFRTGSLNYCEFDKNNILVKWYNIDKFIIIPASNEPISIGSTKEEVIKALGAPTSLTSIAFTFGDARVNFDSNGKVTSYVQGTNTKIKIK